MEIRISAKHMELTPALKDYVNERMDRIKKYSDSLIDAEVYLGVEKHRNQVHAKVKGNGHLLNSEAVDPTSMYKAIDICVDKLETQLRKGKQNHHSKKVGKEALRAEVIGDIPPNLSEDEVV